MEQSQQKCSMLVQNKGMRLFEVMVLTMPSHTRNLLFLLSSPLLDLGVSQTIWGIFENVGFPAAAP